MEQLSYKQARQKMVEDQLIVRGVQDKRVLEAMSTVPREKFVHRYLRKLAYADSPLPIGSGQTISQPYIVALMTTALDLEPGDKVLEIGTGSGYAAAVLSLLCSRVITIECIHDLARRAKKTLSRLGYDNVDVIEGDGTLGWPEQAPYDAIVATAGGPHIPSTLKVQLAENGRLVMPVGDLEHYQSLMRLERVGDTEYRTDNLGEVRFVPLVGAEGWSPDGVHAPRDPLRKALYERRDAHDI